MGEENQAITVMSDEEMVVHFCTSNKVSKSAAEELLKRGFTSLEALKLVHIDDLASDKIPRGQRRLILHIVDTMLINGTADGTAKTDAGTPHTEEVNGTAGPAVTVSQIEEPDAVQNGGNSGNEHSDIYQQLINNLVAKQSSVVSSMQSSSADHASIPAAQPSWNDPQIHISSASGKSVSNYLDICDFVQSSVEEDVILGGQGEQQIIVKSGPKRPRLENLTLCQWSVANLSILYKLVGDKKLIGPALLDYLSYTTKVYQLIQRYSLVSVLLFDREYRKLQASMNFRWGTDVQHLHTLFLQPREKTAAQGQSLKKGKGNMQNGKPDKERKDTPICRNFNAQKGCSFPNCSFRHVCLLPGCLQKHSAQSHVEKN